MLVNDDAIVAAYRQHSWVYAKRQRAWDVRYHVRLWQTATKAFERSSFEAYQEVYDELRRKWQVFRGGQSNWSCQQAYDVLRKLNSAYARKRLTELVEDDVNELWNLLQAVKDIKKNSSGLSVVAISKFLHFWNPRLFMIVDDGVIWRRVFERQWLWDQVEPIRNKVEAKLFDSPVKRSGDACDLSSYLAILVWAGRVLRDNPAIVTHFTAYITNAVKDNSLPADIAEYEAVAIEWFLLGVVELPPSGVGLEVPHAS